MMPIYLNEGATSMITIST